jgi:2-octaprenyl-6-methoxyphenol hydroxylase
MAFKKRDIVIAGGGYVGLTTAVAIKSAASDLTVAVVDRADPKVSSTQDFRASAIAAAARRMLTALGVWKALADNAQSIDEMVVTDSKRQDAMRPIFLTFDGTVTGGEPFAHMVANADLVMALRARAKTLGVELISGDTVTGFDPAAHHVTVSLGSGKKIVTSLLVAADGVRSNLRALAGIKTVDWRYGQSGLVTTVEHERPHHGRAVEHFLPAGPFAILPLKGNRSSLVWVEKTKTAESLVSADDLIFQFELEERFGHQLGALKQIGPRVQYPLGLTLARDFVRPRFALVGDAAHGIHPIAGQGLNMGFKDAAALAQTIVESNRLGLDIGGLHILQDYERWRRFDAWRMGAVTDSLNRLFSNDSDGLRFVRDFGLGIVDRLPQLKKYFISEAAGIAGPQPRLLNGEEI